MLAAVAARSFRPVCKIFGNSTRLNEIKGLRSPKLMTGIHLNRSGPACVYVTVPLGWMSLW